MEHPRFPVGKVAEIEARAPMTGVTLPAQNVSLAE
jgi:hypothetical protein